MEINYAEVLADLKQKRLAIDDAIRGISAMLHLNGGPPSPAMGATSDLGVGSESSESAPTIQHIPPDAFFGISIVEATKKFLSMQKRPKSTLEIKDALESGGYNHTSKNFYATIFSGLSRENNKPTGSIVKVNDLWGLADWYPNRRRESSRRKANHVDSGGLTPDEESADDERLAAALALVKVS